MKRTIAAVLALVLFLPALASAESPGMRMAELDGYGIAMEIPEKWDTVDGKAAYNTESIDFAEQNFPIAAHMVFSDEADQNHVHAFKVTAEVMPDGEGALAAMETFAGENGGWFEVNGLQFFVFVDVERSLCCAMSLVESGMVILAAQPIDDPAFVAAFDEMLGSVKLPGVVR